jgi:abhydrolase domain-containing protein 5
LIHGFLLALGLWIHNIDQLARDRTVNAIDLFGFGSSGRPIFSNYALEAERQMVKSI